VHNLHGIPGFLGGIVSAVVAAVYTYPSTVDAYTPTLAEFPQIDMLINHPYKQGGLQIATTFCSLGIGIVTAIVTGIVLKLFVYNFSPTEFFNDGIYFEEA
jgi:ammonium transporter Rh